MLHTLLNYIRAFNNFLLFFVIFSISVFSKHDHLSFTLFIETLTSRFYFRNSDLFVNIIILYIISIKSSLIYYNNIILSLILSFVSYVSFASRQVCCYILLFLFIIRDNRISYSVEIDNC